MEQDYLSPAICYHILSSEPVAKICKLLNSIERDSGGRRQFTITDLTDQVKNKSQLFELLINNKFSESVNNHIFDRLTDSSLSIQALLGTSFKTQNAYQQKQLIYLVYSKYPTIIQEFVSFMINQKLLIDINNTTEYETHFLRDILPHRLTN